MSKKYTLGFEPEELSHLVEEYADTIYSKGRELEKLNPHFQEKFRQFEHLYSAALPHYAKHSAVVLLQKIFQKSDVLSEYKRRLYRVINDNKPKISRSKAIEMLKSINTAIIQLEEKNIEDLSDYHNAIVDLVVESQKRENVALSWADCSDRPSHFMGELFPKLKKDEYLEKGLAYCKERVGTSIDPTKVNDQLLKFFLHYNHQGALRHISGLFHMLYVHACQENDCGIDETTISNNVKLLNCKVSEDGDLIFEYITHRFSTGSDKGIVSTSREVIKVSYIEDLNDDNVTLEDFRNIHVRVLEAEMTFFDEERFKEFLAPFLTVILKKISNKFYISSFDKSVMKACLHLSGGLSPEMIYARAWSSHHELTLVLRSVELLEKIESLPNSARLMECIKARTFTDALEAVEAEHREEQPKVQVVVEAEVAKQPKETSDLEKEIAELLALGKPALLIEACSNEKLTLLRVRAYRDLLTKDNTIKYLGPLASMPEDSVRRILNDIHLLVVLFSVKDYLTIIAKNKVLINIALDVIKENFPTNFSECKKALTCLAIHLKHSVRLNLLIDKGWQSILFKLVLNDLALLPLLSKMIANINNSHELILSSSTLRQKIQFFIALKLSESSMQKKVAQLEQQKEADEQKLRMSTLAMRSLKLALEGNARGAAMNKAVDIDEAQKKHKALQQEYQEAKKTSEVVGKQLDETKAQLSMVEAKLSITKQFMGVLLEKFSSEQYMVGVNTNQLLTLLYGSEKSWREIRKYIASEEEPIHKIYACHMMVEQSCAMGLEGLIDLSNGEYSSPEVLTNMFCKAIEGFEVESCKKQLDGLLLQLGRFEHIYSANHSADYIERIIAAIVKKVGMENARQFTFILSNKWMLNYFSSDKFDASSFRLGMLPAFVFDHADIELLTLFTRVAASVVSQCPHFPDQYVQRLQNSWDDANQELSELSKNYISCKWVFTVCANWKDPTPKAKEILSQAYQKVMAGFSASDDAIESLCSMTSEHLQQYLERFDGITTEEWIAVLDVNFEKNKCDDLLKLYLRLCRFEQAKPFCDAFLSPSLLDRFILISSSAMLVDFIKTNPIISKRAVELFVMIRGFRENIRTNETFFECLLKNVDTVMAVQLAAVGVEGALEYVQEEDVNDLSPSLLRELLNARFKFEVNTSSLLTPGMLKTLLRPTDDYGDINILPLLLRLLYRSRVEVNLEDFVDQAVLRARLLDADPMTLVKVFRLNARDQNTALVRNLLLEDDALLRKMFLEVHDSTLAMLLRTDNEGRFIRWIGDALTRRDDHSKVLIRYLAESSYGQKDMNTAFVSVLISTFNLTQLFNVMKVPAVNLRLANQIAHTPMLIGIISRKVKDKTSALQFLRLFSVMDKAFFELSPRLGPSTIRPVWTAFLNLCLKTLLQAEFTPNELKSVAEYFIGTYKWDRVEERLALCAKDRMGQKIYMPCPQLYFLVKILSAPAILLRDFVNTNIGRLLCAEFIHLVDEESHCIRLSGEDDVRWMNCYAQFIRAAKKVLTTNELNIGYDTWYKQSLLSVFDGAEPTPLTLDVSINDPEASVKLEDSTSDDSGIDWERVRRLKADQEREKERQTKERENKDDDHARKCIVM